MFSNKIGKNEMNNFFGVEVGVGCRLIYSGTPPYDHPIITATLFLHEKKRSQSFSFLKSPFNTTTPLIRLFENQPSPGNGASSATKGPQGGYVSN